jgi:hypothetical protein
MQGYERTTITLLGSLIAFLAIFAWLYGFYKVYQNYKESGKKQSFFFSIGLLFGGLAIIFLALELLTFQLFDDNTIQGATYVGKEIYGGINSYDAGLTFGIIAASLSVVSILAFDAFALSFFENKQKYLIFPIVLMILYIIIYIFLSNPIVKLNDAGTDYDITRSADFELIMFGLFMFPLFLPSIVFLMSAIQVRGNKFNFRRSLALCFLQVMIGVGFTIEIVGGEDFMSIISRLMILLYPVSTWSVLQANRFVKKILGAPS